MYSMNLKLDTREISGADVLSEWWMVDKSQMWAEVWSDKEGCLEVGRMKSGTLKVNHRLA